MSRDLRWVTLLVAEIGWVGWVAARGPSVTAAMPLLLVVAALVAVARDEEVRARGALAGLGVVALPWLDVSAWPAFAIVLPLLVVLAAGPGPFRVRSGPSPALAGARAWLAWLVVHPFELATLLLTLALAGNLVRIAATTHTSFDPDGAYYFAVARHIVQTGRLEDPTVWQFLAPPEHVPHAVGDYWQPLTSLLAVPAMALFGPTHAVASASIAGFFGLGSIALWYLVVQRRLIENRFVQLATLVSYGTAPELLRFQLDTETQPVVATCIVFALVLLHHERWRLACGMGLLLLYTRSDAGFAALAIFVVAFVHAPREARAGVAATVVGLGAFYVASSLVRFGHLSPPGASRAPLLAEYRDLYLWHPPLQTPGARLRGILGAIGGVPLHALSLLSSRPFVSLRALGLVGTALGLGAWSSRPTVSRGGDAALAAALAIASVVPMLVVATAGPVFNEGRTLQGLIAAMTVATAFGVDRVCAWRATPSFVGPALATIAAGMLLPEVHLAHSQEPQRGPLCEELRELAPTLGDATVLSELSWWVAAETQASVVHTPLDDADAIEAVIRRYGATYLIAEAGSAPASLARAIPGTSFEAGTITPSVRVVPLRRGDTYRLYRLEVDPAPVASAR